MLLSIRRGERAGRREGANRSTTITPFRTALLLSFLAPAAAGAQRADVHVDHYTAEEGLGQNWVVGIVQDSAGFIWVGTKRGLQRFDGYTFVPYAALDPAAPAELSREIRSIRRESANVLWAATDRRVVRVDVAGRRSWSTRMPSTERPHWVVDSTGTLWYLQESTLRMRSARAPGHSARAVPANLPMPGPACLGPGRLGAIWLATAGPAGGEVRRIDARAVDHRRYAVADISSPCTVVEDEGGRLWLGTPRGLAALSPDEGRFHTVSGLAGIDVGDIEPDRRGGVWVLTGRSLMRVDSTLRVVGRWAPPRVFEGNPLTQDLEPDREGGLWVATLTQGVFRVAVEPPVFAHASGASVPPMPLGNDFVIALHEQADGTLWAGMLGGGITRIAADWSRATTLRHEPEGPWSLASDDVWEFEEDTAGNVWAVTNGGICLLRNDGAQCHRSPLANPGFSSVERDHDGRFWLGVLMSGVIGFDPATRSFGAHLQVPGNLQTLYLDQATRHLWVGTLGEGIWRMRLKTGSEIDSLRPVPTPGWGKAAIFDLHRDRSGTLWVASDRGLGRWNPLADLVLPVDAVALRNTTVFSIENDDDGRLWLGTAHGLASYVPSSGATRRYRRADGVLSGEFNRRAALRRRDGSMVFGGIQGLTMFRPRDVVARRDPAPLVFTRWRKVMASGAMEAPLDGVSALRLLPDDRAFTIEFAALSFAPGPTRRYRYRVDGLDADWVEVTEPRATYGAPPPGRYVFRVQSSGTGESDWVTPGASLALVVVPPFYATAWFKALVVALVIASAWMLHRLRLRQALATERLRLRISRDLHDEVGAGLSSIALFSDAVNNAPTIGPDERRYIARIGEAARKLTADLRDIVWTIDPDGDRLDDVVSRMRDTAAVMVRGVELSFTAPAAAQLAGPVTMSARRDLLLLYKEILHNVARHARATAVRIGLHVQDGRLELTVSDDGVGFDTRAAPSGTGLRSITERVARLGGELDLESYPGKGTTVRVRMKLA